MHACMPNVPLYFLPDYVCTHSSPVYMLVCLVIRVSLVCQYSVLIVCFPPLLLPPSCVVCGMVDVEHVAFPHLDYGVRSMSIVCFMCVCMRVFETFDFALCVGLRVILIHPHTFVLHV
jgi:hypothetical protein